MLLRPQKTIQSEAAKLRAAYQTMTSWQKYRLSSTLTETLENKASTSDDIFFAVMSGTNLWHKLTRYSPTSEIWSLFLLPEAQPCMTLNIHSLLTRENFNSILRNSHNLKKINAALSALSEQAKSQDVLSMVLNHPTYFFSCLINSDMDDHRRVSLKIY